MKKVQVEELHDLGFESAARTITETKELERKIAVAYEHFRYVTPKNIQHFNTELRKKSEQRGDSYYQYDKLVFTDIAQYPAVPPADVLLKLKEAKQLNIFDTFTIGKIESVKELVDPILFGVVTGCPDLFYIGQWDNDVKIEDILKENEG